MRTLLSLLGALALLLTGCKKEPGEGGKSELRGRVVEQAMNENTCQPMGQPYPLLEARVYIMYGDHDFPDDDVRTGPEGVFVFSWLRKGDYRVYVVGECRDDCETGCSGEQRITLISTTVDGKSGVTDVGTLSVKNYSN